MKTNWKDNDVMTQALIIGYNQVRDYEDAEKSTEMLEVLCKSRLV